MAPVKDKWIRRFIITETRRHKKGFTIYKVTSVVRDKCSRILYIIYYYTFRLLTLDNIKFFVFYRYF